MTTTLPAAPARLTQDTRQPAFGVYAGVVPELDWQPLPLSFGQRLLAPMRHKRWQYVAVAHRDFVFAAAVVDAGWIGSAFAYLFDRRSGTLLADLSANSPPLSRPRLARRPFGDAGFAHGGLTLAFRREDDRLALELAGKGLSAAAHIALPAQEQVLAAIAPGDWLAHATHKTSALPVSGFVDCGGQRFSLDGGHASLDCSDGLLARETGWHWASAHGPDIGFNLQAGYMGDAENAVWLNGHIFRTAAARFRFDSHKPLSTWHIDTEDGLVSLTFTPEGARSQNQNLLIAASRYIQPVGRFDGSVTHPDTGAKHLVSALCGVTEDHFSRW
ncbi:DUF2804 domain-containing protein [uncultured Aquitalea sp.]|uniref:DUF2804 domain-containing protein n=1 Tax=uncultured Aquitalea sp. TaxID=540272 RepID=UPI0025FB7BDA|nr:DUF2804 domain-containing protein [uncultured Aquitalea sp.]